MILALTAVAAGLVAPPAGAAAARDCGSVVSEDARYPVRVVSGDVACADAEAALAAFLDAAAPPEGWACARGHRNEAHAARCASEPGGEDVVEALNPPRLDAPATARRRGKVRAVASGLERGRYTLTLVADEQPAPGVRCLARVGRARATKGGWVTLRGRLPRRIRCYEGLRTPVGRFLTPPGRYHLVVGVKVAPAGWDADRSFLRSPLRLR